MSKKGGKTDDLGRILENLFDKIDGNPASIITQLDQLGAIHSIILMLDDQKTVCGKYIRYNSADSEIPDNVMKDLSCSSREDCLEVLRKGCQKEALDVLVPLVSTNLLRKFVSTYDKNAALLVHGFSRKEVLLSQIKLGVWALYNLFLFDKRSKKSVLSAALNTPAGILFFSMIGKTIIDPGNVNKTGMSGVDATQEVLFSVVAKQIAEEIKVNKGLNNYQAALVFAFVKNYMTVFTHMTFEDNWRYKNTPIDRKSIGMFRASTQYLMNFIVDAGLDMLSNEVITA